MEDELERLAKELREKEELERLRIEAEAAELLAQQQLEKAQNEALEMTGARGPVLIIVCCFYVL
jgi:hypothetical protein